MTILDGYELCFLPIRMSLLRCFLYSIKESKMKKVLTLFQAKVITRENFKMKTFKKNNILHNFSTSRIPQQHGVVERKNKSLQEMILMLMIFKKHPKFIWTMFRKKTMKTKSIVMDQTQVDKLSKIEPKTGNEVVMDDGWIKTMQK
ncbi:hypothetical protein CR513_51175, partial [Mucuna pruriens]